MRKLHVHSEIGPLKSVCVHRPGDELLNLSPTSLDRMLFDDIPFLDVAQAEHDTFTSMLADEGVEVVYFDDLVAQALETGPEARGYFIDTFVANCGLEGPLLKEAVREFLSTITDAKELVRKSIVGIRPDEVELDFGKDASLADLAIYKDLNDEHLFVDPIPNLYFMRDPFSVIGSGVNINTMQAPTRVRETPFVDTVYRFHPDFRDVRTTRCGSAKDTIEGGDILVLSDRMLAVGVSQRTTAQAVDALARNILWCEEESFDCVLACTIPRTRAFMHLDTVLTHVDVDTFTVHPNVLRKIELYRLERGKREGEIRVRYDERSFREVLAEALGLPAIRLIKCGGGDPIAAAREQWNDGSNTLAIAPGRIMVYQRNTVTNEILAKENLELIEVPSAELSRGRGGPHCMSMSLYREDL